MSNHNTGQAIQQVYVSGTGWLCMLMRNGTQSNFVPVFQLTPEQIREYNECKKLAVDPMTK